MIDSVVLVGCLIPSYTETGVIKSKWMDKGWLKQYELLTCLLLVPNVQKNSSLNRKKIIHETINCIITITNRKSIQNVEHKICFFAVC